MPFLLKTTFTAIILTYLGTTSHAQTLYDPVCGLIANAVSSASRVAYPGQDHHSHKLKNRHILNSCRTGSVQFNTDIYHFTSSSSQPAACTVEPGTVNDVGIVVGPLGVLPSDSTLTRLCWPSVDDTRESRHAIRGTRPRSPITSRTCF